MSTPLLIQNAWIIDPVRKKEFEGDLLIEGGKISAIDDPGKIPGSKAEDYILGGNEDKLKASSSEDSFNPLTTASARERPALMIFNRRKLKQATTESFPSEDGLFEFLNKDKKLEALVAIAHLIY